MKHSVQLGEAIISACKSQEAWNSPGAGDPGTRETLTAAIYGNTAALLEIARQIAITREESQNGKSSRFDR